MFEVVAVISMLLLALAVVAERALVTRAPREAERRLTAWLGVPTAVVAVGRPRDWLRHRRVPSVVLAADHLSIPDTTATIDRLEVQLVGVRIEGRGPGRRVTAEGGTFRAILGEPQVRRLVELPPLVRRLDLRGDGVRLVTSTGLTVRLRLTLSGGAIELRPVGNPLEALLPVRHRITLPNLPAGARIEGVLVRDGRLVVSGPIDGSRLVAS